LIETPAEQSMASSFLLGVNLAGAEFGSNVPGVFGIDYTYPTHTEIDYYASKGMGVIRLPFLWERMQRAEFAALDATELGRLDDVVNYATGKGLKIEIEPHNFGYGFGALIGSAQTPNSAFADFWSKLALHFQSNSNVVFGLMNEPHDQSASAWLGSANAAIAAIRSAGAVSQEILVPGSYWDGAWTWTSTDNDTVIGAGVQDSAHNFAFEVHQYLDADGSGTHPGAVSATIGVERLTAITQWAEATGNHLFLGEVGVTTDQTSLTAFDGMLTYMQQHANAWEGVTYWAGGPWWGNYMFSIEPQNGVEKPQMTILVQHLASTGTGWEAVASGDFNGDGVADLLWKNAATGVTQEWLMSPNGGVAAMLNTPAAPGWSVVATGDFNGDHIADLLWQHASGATAEWLMAPTGGAASLLGTPAAPGWNVVATGDFNGDHIADLLWQHVSSGATAEWLMAPTGGVGSMLSTPAAGGWTMVASGDFNGDHIMDLMWQHASTGATAEWLMAPTGGVGSMLSTPGAGGWTVVASGDFNGDHIADLLWQHASSGATAEWLMAPTGGAGSMLSTPPAGGWSLIASGDFNGDGNDDLLWQNAAGATSEWLMAGGSVASNPFTPPAPGWDVVATGHLNGDATIDLMWQNALTGATAEWLLAPTGGVGSFLSTPML
jgi:endoglucanase